MDPLSQAVLGGAIGQALFHRHLGRRAFVLGAAAGLLPDIDIIIKFDQWSGWKYHRGATHSLFFPFLAAPILARCTHSWAQWRERRAHNPTRQIGRYWDHFWVIFLALLSHPFLDWTTSYGTQIFLPLTDQRFALNAMSVIDPIYTLPLVISAVFGWFAWRRTEAVQRAATVAFLVSLLVIAAGWAMNERTRALAKQELAADGFSTSHVFASPSIFQPFLRRIVAWDAKEVRIGYYTFLSSNPIRWQTAARRQSNYIQSLKDTDAGKLLHWFAQGQVYYRQYFKDGKIVVEGHDVRYGAPGTGANSFWGIRAAFDLQGRIVDGPDRFRNQRRLNADTFKSLYFAMVGDPRGVFSYYNEPSK